jgi:hypothetical protein
MGEPPCRPSCQLSLVCLEGLAYVEHGVFGRSVTATSVVLEGFSIVVDAVFDAA